MSTSGQGREVSMATPWTGTTPVGSCQLAPSHWNQISGKILIWPPYLPKRFETSEGKGGLGAWFARTPANWSATISQNPQKFEHKTPAIWSATISSNLQRFACTQAKCHASEGEAPSPCDHPASCHMHFRGNPLTPVRHKPATSIGSILTLPKLHLATFINVTTTNISNRWPDSACVYWICMFSMLFSPFTGSL